VIHLAIVHIEESGSAEPHYQEYYGRRSRWKRYRNDEDNEEAGNDDDFEIVEVTDGTKYLDAMSSTHLPLAGPGFLLFRRDRNCPSATAQFVH
jgi:hypothetical protein